MLTPSKPLIAAGALLIVGAGVLAWQVRRQFGSGGQPMSADAAATASLVAAEDGSDEPSRRRGGPNLGEGERVMVPPSMRDGRGGGNEEFSWSSDDASPEEMADRMAEMERGNAVPADEPMTFKDLDPEAADVELLEKALEASLSSGEWASAIEAWKTFMRPIVSGDAHAMATAIEALGGETEGAESLHARLSGYLRGAAVAWEMSKVRIANADVGPRVPELPQIPGMELPAGAVPMMAMVSEIADDEGNVTQTHNVNMPLGGVFPQIVGANDRTRYLEIWTPTRLASNKTDRADLGVSVFLARLDGRWTPAAVRLGLRSDLANTRFRETVSAARAAQLERANEGGDR